MPSKVWSISTDVKRSVPLYSRCSRKCEMPPCSGDSLREPVPIQRPSAIDRTDGIRSDTTRTPESSRVSLWPSVVVSALALVAGVGAARAVAAAIPPAVAVPAAAATVAAAASAAPATATGAHRGELLGRLARDVGVVGEAQADT